MELILMTFKWRIVRTSIFKSNPWRRKWFLNLSVWICVRCSFNTLSQTLNSSMNGCRVTLYLMWRLISSPWSWDCEFRSNSLRRTVNKSWKIFVDPKRTYAFAWDGSGGRKLRAYTSFQMPRDSLLSLQARAVLPAQLIRHIAKHP